MNLDDHYHICFLNTIKSKRETKMKQLSYLLFLLAGLWLAGCDDSSDASLIPEIMPTEQGSDTYVMKGYESAGNGFNVYKPEAIGGHLQKPVFSQISLRV